jgi:uncharacterized membrane-anchored protein
MRKVVAIVAGVAMLVLVNVIVMQRERLLAEGRPVLLELAPVDPRSLMQGDYMALEFRAAIDARHAAAVEQSRDGHLVLALDERGVAKFVRRDDGSPLGEREVRLRYRMRDGRVKLVTNAWFFEEGQAAPYAAARYGEFRVADGGEALLARMRDDKLLPIEPAAKR